MLKIGSYLDNKYKVLGKLGQGGSSIVYLALNERANKTWAIKEVPKQSLQGQSPFRQELLAEINILKGLDHKYIPTIIDILEGEDSFLIIMDYVQGRSLDRILLEHMKKAGRPLPPNQVADIGKQLCEALYYLHSRPRPIIYRDLKPANVILRPNGEISLIDFGTARIFKEGNAEDTICLGTPGYAAPEQYGGRGQSSPQSDIYCLGAALHHLVTGRDPAPTPFHFPLITECRPQLFEETDKESRDLLLGLEKIIEKCTRYHAGDRYKNCLELCYDLEHIKELSEPYRKILKRKLRIFFLWISLAVFCLAGCLCCHILAAHERGRGHESLYEAALTDADEESRLSLLKECIRLSPTDLDPYMAYLDVIEGKEDFNASIRALLQEQVDGESLGEILKNQVPQSYGILCCRIAFTYFFMTEGGSERSLKAAALPYFEAAKEADLSAKELEKYGYSKELIDSCYAICVCYDSLGETDPITGISKYSYGEYFCRLKDLAGEQSQQAKTMTGKVMLLKTYQMLCQEFSLYAKQMAEDGAGREDFLDLLASMEADSEKLDFAGNEAAKECRENILQEVPEIRESLESIYEELES